MGGKLGKPCRWGSLLSLLGTLFLAGCSSGPGGTRITLFPERQTLIPAAQEVRQPPVALPLPRELDPRVLPAYVVEPGDVLLVQPADLDAKFQLPGDQPVLPDGTISLGRYGQVIVAGKTVREIEELVRAVLAAQVKDAGAVVVRLVARQSKVYYVLGAVVSPGVFPLAGRETVLDGIVAAGGLNDRASRQNIILARPTAPDSCRVVLPVCYREIVQVGDTTTNYQLQPGDRIFVASKTLLEDLFGGGHTKCSCGGLHIPCPIGAGHGCSGPAASNVVVLPGPAPEAPHRGTLMGLTPHLPASPAR